MPRPPRLRSAILGLCVLLPVTAGATTLESRCHREIVSRIARYKSEILKRTFRCLDARNAGKFEGPCLDASTTAKLAAAAEKVRARIAMRCSTDSLTALGFRTDCAYGPVDAGIEATCAALPVTTSLEFADCLLCWEQAELARLEALFYASHAADVCGGTADATSPVCANLGCVAPLPDQRALDGSAEATCQRQIGSGGAKYLLKRDAFLSKCGLKGLTRAECLVAYGAKMQTLASGARIVMQKGCAGRAPDPSPPFCCRTGAECSAASSRDDCTTSFAGVVEEDSVCRAGGQCEPAPGSGKLTWWGACPLDATCGTALLDQTGLLDCAVAGVDHATDRLACLAFPANGGLDWPCP